jgi:hypothetical protein
MKGSMEGLVPVVVVIAFVLAPLHALVHEAGHAAAALVLTRRAVFLHVGNVGPRVRMRIGRLYVSLRYYVEVPDEDVPSAVVLFESSRPAADLAISAAGPLALAVAALAAVALIVAAPAKFTVIAGVAFLLFCAVGLAQLVPRDTGRIPSDGAAIRDAWRRLHAR